MDTTFLFVACSGLVFCAITMLAVTDVILKDFGSTPVKAMWGFVSLIPFVGWLIYLLFGFKKGVRIRRH